MYTKKLKKNITRLLLRKDGKSTNQWIYRDSWVKKNNLESLINEIKSCTDWVSSDRLDERIYCILNGIQKPPLCYCGTPVKFKRFQLGYSDYCSVSCRANSYNWQNNVKETRLEKYGVEHIAQLDEEREKRSSKMKELRPTFDNKLMGRKVKESIERIYGKHYNTGWNEKAIKTRIDNGNMVPIEILDEYMEYRVKVELISNKQPIQLLENIEYRGVLGYKENAHHIDHILSIYDGFMNDIKPEIVGHICNLQCIPAMVNLTKRNDSWITKEELLKRYEEWNLIN